jgi:hypothetical protein
MLNCCFSNKRNNMKKILLCLLVIIIGCTNAQKEQPVKTNEYDANPELKKSDSLQVLTIVDDFFKAFDERDLQKINTLLIPTTKIVHYTGVTTNTAEMIKITAETKNWWPRTRKLSDVEFFGNTDMAVLGVTNEVIFSLPENKKVTERYKETWIFEKIEKQWKPVRCHYSKITGDNHSEEVE